MDGQQQLQGEHADPDVGFAKERHGDLGGIWLCQE